MIKTQDKQSVGDHLKLPFYYINKEQKLVVMYLEVIFTGIKTERWKVAEVSKFAYLGIAAGRKDCLCSVWDQ